MKIICRSATSDLHARRFRVYWNPAAYCKYVYSLTSILSALPYICPMQISEEDLTFPGVRHELPAKNDDDFTMIFPDRVSSTADSTLARPRAPTPSSSMNSDEQEIPMSAIPSMTQDTNRNSESAPSQADLSVIPEEIPVNPYDHSLLEFIYNEMHAARFINIAPLSLLSNTLPLYFQGANNYCPF